MRSLVVLLLIAVFAACPSKPEVADGKAVLGTEGKQRWIVTFDGGEPDLQPYRDLLKSNPDDAEALAEKSRKKLAFDHADFETQLQGLGGRIVEHWWMSNAVTIELDANAVPSLKKQGGVKSVAEDVALGE